MTERTFRPDAHAECLNCHEPLMAHRCPPPPLRDEDRALLNGILEATGADPRVLWRLIYTYYSDADRAERTDPAVAHQCVGMLAGSMFKDDAEPHALSRIAALLDGQMWDLRTLDLIAAVLRDAGYRVEEVTG